MVEKAPAPRQAPRAPANALFAGAFGLFMAVALLKFGNPVILDHLVDMPRTPDEWRAFSWPVRVGYIGLALVSLLGLWQARGAWRPRAPAVLVGLLLLWLGWQFVAAIASTDRPMTRVVLAQFTACTVCFFLGHLALARVQEPRVFWACLTFGFIGILGMACQQRWGGLEETRRMILQSGNAAKLAPEYLARIESNRVFSTLVYPNALAGAILLILPLAVVVAARFGRRWQTPGMIVCGVTMLFGGLSVLVWSGSKAGWLLAMIMAVGLLLHSPLNRRIQVGIATVFVVVGLVGFGAVYSKKLRAGATSVSARLDYWTAAVKGFAERPLLGQGPGAFKRVYARLRPANAEMAQLAHNDYLQQATDSGWIGFAAYAGFVAGSLGWLYRNRSRLHGSLPVAVAVGVAGWFTQGLGEFGLYIPATSWCAFTLLGWLLAQTPSRPQP